MPEDLPPIYIIKKKIVHGGHHGGAWKVAYADFVTAMMALFIVLWLLNSSEQVQKAVSAYFTDPSGSGKKAGSSSAGAGETVSVNKDDMRALKEKIEKALKKSPEFEKFKDHVKMTVTGDGLRIEMIESENGVFFQSGKAVPTAFGEEMIHRLTAELVKLPNSLMIEGHTDARSFADGAAYGNWELSTDRANAARRVMEAASLAPGRIAQVRGFADQQLSNKKDPENATNRRVSVIVRYQDVTAADQEKEEKEEKEAEKASKKKGEKTPEKKP